jgi:hypothetical protein
MAAAAQSQLNTQYLTDVARPPSLLSSPDESRAGA